MSAFNPYYPNTFNPYQQAYQPYQQANFQQPQQSQSFTQPTIRAEIVQIDGDEAEANNFPVQTGGTQMMINKAEDKIFIKTVYANNQTNLDIFVKQKPAPAQPQPNFDNFVTREELEQRLSQLSVPTSQPTTRKKKEESVNE
jgi:hypothetical protein